MTHKVNPRSVPLHFSINPSWVIRESNCFRFNSNHSDTLSSSNQEGGCGSFFVKAYECILWLFLKIFCCTQAKIDKRLLEDMKEFLATVELSQKKEFEEEWRRKFDALPKSLQEPLIKALIRRTINENGKGIVNLDDQTYQMYREIAEGDLKCLFTFQKDGEDLIEVINPELSLTIESVLANL